MACAQRLHRQALLSEFKDVHGQIIQVKSDPRIDGHETPFRISEELGLRKCYLQDSSRKLTKCLGKGCCGEETW